MIFGIALLFACSVHAQKMSDYISIKGEYLQKVEPDRLVLTVKLDEKDSKGKRSLAGQQRDMLRELKKLHVDLQTQLRVQGMESALHSRRRGNMTSAYYEIELSTPEQLYTVHEALDRLGVSSVAVSYTHLTLPTIDRSDRDELETQGEIEALNNARRKAERLAATEGRRVGKCFYISDNKSYSSAEEFSLPRSGFMEDEMLDITRYDSKSSEESLLLPLTIGDVQIYSTVFAAFTLE